MNDPVTIRRVYPKGHLAKGLRIKLTKLHRIDDHLYSFRIIHPSVKYVDIGDALSWTKRKKSFLFLMLSDPGDKDLDDVTSEDYISGAAKGAFINVNFGKDVTAVLAHYIALKYETQVYLMIEYKGENIFATT